MSDTKKQQQLKQKARLELNEKEELSPEILEKFRNLIREMENFSCPMDDDFLLRFLRARKFNLERTLKLLKQYYNMRRCHSELFRNLSPSAVLPALGEGLQIVLDHRDSKGRNIFVFRAGNWNPAKVNLDDIFRCNYLFLEEMTSTMATQINGVIAIVDFNGFSFSNVRHFTPKHAQRMIQIIQDSFPCRFQEFHLVNQPYVLDLLFTVVKPFLTDKIRRRIQFHGKDLGTLHKIVHPSILPVFLGGRAQCSTNSSAVTVSMMKKDEYYKSMCQYGFRD